MKSMMLPMLCVMGMLCAQAIAQAQREVAPAVAPAYAADRKLAKSDFIRLDWKDKKPGQVQIMGAQE